ncbi:HAD family phosphatase [Candidatus Woesearchaeota archaeon]|nr:HAD family phosphatase [Candidatus Woesearchaeota archaeon]
MITKLAKWLQLTAQQATLVHLIYALQEKNLPTNPISLEKVYLRETKTFIQKSNLFTQLKFLQERGIVSKTAQSNYILHLRGIQEVLYAQKQELTQEIDDLTLFTSETQAFFDKIVKPTSTSVTYLTTEELYKNLAFNLKNATAFYLGCDFPHYAYSLLLCANAQEAAYVEMLTARIQDNNFSLFCISPYRLESLSYKLQDKYKNKDLIKEELKNVYAHAQTITIQCPNIDLRKSPTPFNFALIENPKNGNTLFMFLKDSKGAVTGGILINSYETTKQTKQHFLTQLGLNPMLKKSEDFPVFSDVDFLPSSEIHKKKLIAFDVNRIFTVNHTTVELANLIGREKAVLDFITKQIEGLLSMQEAIIESARLLKGLSVKEIEKLLPYVTLMKNVKKGILKLKEANYYLVAISSGFSHLVTPICKELGIDEVYCNVLGEKEGKLTGEVIERNVLADDVKYYIVKYLQERLSIPQERSIGVGDGYSDIPLLKSSKKRICFNPSKKMKELFKAGDPAITHLVEEPDFMNLVEEILKNKD